jgi:folate-dependent phosphoribosylglycinamide formyltransferase PurN
MKRVVVLASGGGTDFQSIIDYHQKLSDPAWKIVGLITNNPEAGAIVRAKKADIIPMTVLAGKEELDGVLQTALTSLEPDLIVLAGWLKMIGPKVLAKYQGKIINIHPGPLPETAGSYGLGVHQKVLELGPSETAINVHFVDADYDTGLKIVTYPVPVLTVAKYLMDKKAGAEILQEHVLNYEHKLLPLVVDLLCDNDELSVTDTVTVVRDGKEVINHSHLEIDL